MSECIWVGRECISKVNVFRGVSATTGEAFCAHGRGSKRLKWPVGTRCIPVGNGKWGLWGGEKWGARGG